MPLTAQPETGRACADPRNKDSGLRTFAGRDHGNRDITA